MTAYYSYQQGIRTPFHDMVCFLLRTVNDPRDLAFARLLRQFNCYEDLQPSDRDELIRILETLGYFDTPGDEEEETLVDLLKRVRFPLEGGDE